MNQQYLVNRLSSSISTLSEAKDSDYLHISSLTSRYSDILREYQVHGVTWLAALHKNNLHGIVADEMGLGKTLQTATFLIFLAEMCGSFGPHLMVGPLSVLSTWISEINKFYSAKFDLLIYYGEKVEREQNIASFAKHYLRQRRKSSKRNQQKIFLILTTYSIAINDASTLRNICSRFGDGKFDYLIVDEAHRIKRQSCVLHQRLLTIPNQHRILLTGTPLQNNVHELWSLLQFLNPGIFTADEEEEIVAYFNQPFMDKELLLSTLPTAAETNATLRKKSSGSQLFLRKSSEMVSSSSQQPKSSQSQQEIVIRQLRQILKPFILRRLKKDVAIEIPPKVIKVIKCPLSPLQRELILIVRHMVQHRIMAPTQLQHQHKQTALPRSVLQLRLDAFNDNDISSTLLAKALMMLRKLCNHPFIALQHIADIADNRYLIETSGKLAVLHALIQPLLLQGSKILIFSQMTTTLGVIEEYLSMQSISCFRIDGLTPQLERQVFIHEFSQSTCDVHVFLLTTPAGGVGINLQAADVVILFDQDWNPQQDLQAIGRTHRIGQTKTVLVLRLISVGPDDSTYSVEERMFQRAMRKLQAGKQILASSSSNRQNSPLKRGEDSEDDDGSVSADGDDQAEPDVVESNQHLPFKWTSLFANKQQQNIRNHGHEHKKTELYLGPSPCCRERYNIDMCFSDESNYYFNDEDLAILCKRENTTYSCSNTIAWQDDDYVEINVQFSNQHSASQQDSFQSISRPWIEAFRKHFLPSHPLQHQNHAAMMDDYVQGPRLRRRTKTVKHVNDGSLIIAPLASSGDNNFEDGDDSIDSEFRRSKRTRRFQQKSRSPVHFSPFSDVYRAKRKKSTRTRELLDADGSYSSEGRTTFESNADDEEDEDICVLCGQAGLSNEEFAILTKLQHSFSHDKEFATQDEEGDVDTMILCDGCDGAYHMLCVGLQAVPEDDWFCLWCKRHGNSLQQSRDTESSSLDVARLK